jgi:hypothetical protein
MIDLLEENISEDQSSACTLLKTFERIFFQNLVCNAYLHQAPGFRGFRDFMLLDVRN